MNERPVSHVPRTVIALLALGLALQVAWNSVQRAPTSHAEELPSPPPSFALRLIGLGESIAVAKVLMLQLQAFDYQSGTRVSFQALDYSRVQDWLALILELDPRGQYPLLAASRLYAEVADETKQRSMLDFVYQQYLLDPNRRWPWLAHATFLAKHRLKDIALARKYASALQKLTTARDVPPWVTSMEIFILEDLNELETARVLIGGLLASGRVTDRGELHFLNGRLLEIEQRIQKGRQNNKPR